MHYLANKEAYVRKARAFNVARINATVEQVLDYLAIHPCVDCAESDPVVLQFDHRGRKNQTISRMIGNGIRWETILREVAACEVRCVNCHVRRHAAVRRARRS